ncbi:hypothetical protein [Aquabacterium sp.]|uniref:hypothetical protein n=1 Tax=Aquabacterium sp. TaxID=1872578 RepID=UPI0035B038F9
MKQYELAEQLGITPAMVSKLAKRGMPTDSVERASRWRKRHLEPGRVKGSKYGTEAKPEAPAARPLPGAAAPLLLDAVAALDAALTAGHEEQLDGLVMEVREQLRAVPDAMVPALPLRVWLCLVDWMLADDAPVHMESDQGRALKPLEFAALVNPDPDWRLSWLWLDEARDVRGLSITGLPDPDPDD